MNSVKKIKPNEASPKNFETRLSTYNYKRVIHICEDASNNRLLVTLIGESGYGKSISLHDYQRSNPSRVFITTVRPSMSMKHFWLAILESMPGISLSRNYMNISMHRIIDRVADYMKERPGSLLIIDEAGKFKDSQLQYIHEVYELTKESSGIILAGPGYFRSNLVRWTAQNKPGIPELMRRINYFEELCAPKRNEIIGFCNFYGITDEHYIRELTGTKNFGTLVNKIRQYLQGNLKTD